MPKIYYISDLHLEFEDENLLKIYVDKEYNDSYLILAGDICSYTSKSKFIKFFEYISKKFKRIIYIAGNHEYYKGKLNDKYIIDLLVSFNNIYFLQDEYITFEEDEVTFYGTTLWSRLDEDNIINSYAESHLNDYKYIRNSVDYKLITRRLTGEMFEFSLELLKDFLTSKTKGKGKIIIISHHLPLYEVICDKYKGYILNSAYASDLHEELKVFNFDCWIFGHTHFSMKYDYVNADNKLIPFMCNPRGYSNENNFFDEDKFIEF